MYGHAREKSVNTVRSAMLKKMVGENEVLTSKSEVDLSRLPHCRDSLVPHIGRVNYRLANYKRAHKSIFWCPNPYDPGQGWEKTEEGILEPVWVGWTVLPPSLVDLLQKTVEEAEVLNKTMDRKFILKSFLLMTRTCRYIYTEFLFSNSVSIMWKHCFEHHLLL